ncbi:agmatinase [Methanofollis formosanus]|uniref:Agmatinase n=1 Tax=Methanofollis formosanus TaxID=299308 RepID=A0A8G1EFB3_9EURY|nr:agmatinase [Methanofollis formosanus]QYZ78001.1 agmatinase [Methanofollis formosanus]
MEAFLNNLFADAEAEYTDARYVVFGVPYDGTSSYRAGSREAPGAIRAVSYNFETYLPSVGVDLWEVPVTDLGDLEPLSLPDLVVGQVEETAAMIAADGKIPVMIGGEHTITPGAVKAVKPQCYVVCDAHLDLRDEFGGTKWNHACATRRVMDLDVEDIFVIGARSGPAEEFELVEESERLHMYTADEVRARGIASVIEEIKEIIGDRSLYLSVDADAVDCCLTPGLGTPEPFGITTWDLRSVVRAFAARASGFDYVEVCPVDAGQTAAVAAKLIREFIAWNWAGKEGL